MKNSRLTEEQIAYALHQADIGTPPATGGQGGPDVRWRVSPDEVTSTTSGKCYLAYTAMLICAFFGRVDAATDPLSKVNRLPEPLETVVGRVTGELSGNGYEVLRGYWALWGSDQCKYTIRVLGRCFGPNPTAPCAIPFLPSWRDEYVDKTLRNVLGPVRLLADLPSGRDGGARHPGGAAASRFLLRLQTYLFTRQAEIPTSDEIFLSVPQDLREILFATAPNPARLITWATIGDSNNNVVFENQTRIPWKTTSSDFSS